MNKKTVSIFGSTGSIGRSTVDLILSDRDAFQVRVLTAGQNVDLLVEQAKALQPECVVVADETRYSILAEALRGSRIEVCAGRHAILEAACQSVDWTMAAIVGLAGLEPVIRSIQNSRAVAIANKEPLVAAGPLVLNEAKQHGTMILPVDSEHNAIFQVFNPHNKPAVQRLILTASGGPFRTWSKEKMFLATPAEAIRHPNWSMGAKISVDSASMMNKALEIIEAHYLFDMPAEKIDVLIHPQSTIHSMVEYVDGSVLAQLGAPDMRTPIAYALAYPERMETSGNRLDWARLHQLTFEAPDFEKFPSLPMSYDVLKAGPASCIVFNAANEVAVAAFLAGRISFGRIYDVIHSALSTIPPVTVATLDDVIGLDLQTRTVAESFIG